MEQARLNSRSTVIATSQRINPNASMINNPAVLSEESRYEENALFPSSVRTSFMQTDRLLGQNSIYDSCSKDRQVENIEKVLVDVKNEQAFSQRQLADFSQQLNNIDLCLRTLVQDKPNINIAIQKSGHPSQSPTSNSELTFVKPNHQTLNRLHKVSASLDLQSRKSNTASRGSSKAAISGRLTRTA